jgi:hypothetical protein
MLTLDLLLNVEFYMKSRMSLSFLSPVFLFLVASCQPPEVQDPNQAIDSLVKEFGYIGFQNPLERATTGTLIGGRPDAVSFVAPASDCFNFENLPRYYDNSEYSRVYNYKFQGSLGFLLSGNPILSAGASLKNDITVEIELSGLIMEYMSSINISDWYTEGMSKTCRSYLNDVGFIIQALKAEELKISFKKISGNSIGINADNVNQYIKFQTGVDWSIEDGTTIVISTPKYIGYQLGRLRLEDEGRTLWRANSIVDGRYFFERISLFDDVDDATPVKPSKLKTSVYTDQYSKYE